MVTQIIIGIIIIVLCSGLCFWWGYSYNAHKYRDQISAIGKQLEAETARNKQLSELNTSLTKRLEDLQTEQQREIQSYIDRIEQSKAVIGSISSGLSGDIEDLSGVIDAIRRIKEAITKIGDL